VASTDGTLPETGLHKGTNWWGAFVIGLAGTILPPPQTADPDLTRG
jgi:hypothetical protein